MPSVREWDADSVGMILEPEHRWTASVSSLQTEKKTWHLSCNE